MSLRSSEVHNIQEVEYEVDELDGEAVLDEETVQSGMRQPIANALGQAFIDLGFRQDDIVGVRISGRTVNDEEKHIEIPFRRWGDLDVNTILGLIELALQSSATIEPPIVIRFVRRPAPVFDRMEGQNKTVFRGDFSLYAKSKRSIVQINPDGDEVNNKKDCFVQWIILGLAFLASSGRIQPIEDLAIDKSSWSKLTKQARKFHNRKIFVERFKTKFNCSEPNEQLFHEIERKYNVRLVLFSIASTLCEFPPQRYLPYIDAKEVICGLLSGEKKDMWTHVDFVTKPETFHPDTSHSSFRFCYFCLQPYKRKQGCDIQECKDSISPRCSFCHSCGSSSCPSCETVECGYSFSLEEEECFPFNSVTKCHHCHKTLFSPKCKESHLLMCRTVFCKRCDECGNKAHAGLKCHEQRCYFCSEKFMKVDADDHKCFIQREKMKENKGEIATYDFECCLDENNVHIPYLCTVWFPEGHRNLEELKTLFPHEIRLDGSPVFVFWGLGNPEERTGVYTFFSLCASPLVKGTGFWAHNSRAYDSIIVKCYFSKYMNLHSLDIQRGQKIMSMQYADLDIYFRDSLSFIPMSLRVIGKEFGITVETEINGVVEQGGKDYFPHSIVTKSFLTEAEQKHFIVDKPQASLFAPSFKAGRAGDEEEKEFKEWCEVNYSAFGDVWDVKTEAIKYCIKDTVLLGKVLVRFRDQLAEIASTITRAEGVEYENFDALAYITLPSAMMSFYLSQALPEKKIGVIHAYRSEKRREAEIFFKWTEHSRREILLPRPCQGVSTDFENEVQARSFSSLFIYLDCYDQGCTRCFSSAQRNIVKNKSIGELWYSTKTNLLNTVASFRGINVVSIWTHEMKVIKETEEFKEWFKDNDIENVLPLIPRDAYKGGKVECFKIAYSGDIEMSDFVSQYPTSLLGESYDPLDIDGDPQEMLKWSFPTGIPSMLFNPIDFDISTCDKMGVIKCRVLCPPNLYAPFLGYKVESRLCSNSYEVLYGSCRRCMETRQEKCNHVLPSERGFFGTWTIAEIKHAVVELGYEIDKVVDIWIYEESSTDLFRSFIAPFMVEKIRSKKSGLITDEGYFTEKGHMVNDYVFELIGRRLNPEEIEDNPARRQVAKLAQNSFTGKWGEIEVHRSSRTFNENEADESRRMLSDPSVTVLFASILDEEGKIIIVDYIPKLQCSRSARRKNDIIVAHITAYGRIMLSRLEKALGRDLLYEDTDSAFHLKQVQKCYRDGFRTGDLELELKNGTNWVCCGRKWYSYLKNGTPVSKIKGFTLKRNNADSFHPDRLLNLILESKRSADEEEEEGPSISVEQTLFKTSRSHPLHPFKETIVSQKKAVFQIKAQKRAICFPSNLDIHSISIIDTLPFGYKE